MTTLAERLIFLMENMDIKQTELADKIGISKQSLYKYLHCKCEPRAEIIARMAKALNTSADFIVGLTNNYNSVIYDKMQEANCKKETELLMKIYKLSERDKIRLEERIDIMLENADLQSYNPTTRKN